MADIKRVERFRSKISGENRKKRIDTQRNFMIAGEEKHTNNLVKIEIEIKKIVNGQPISLLPYYIIFGKEIYRRKNLMNSQSLINEVQTLEQKWLARGLDFNLLNLIKIKYIEGFETWKYFELDISDLDGQNVLA